MNKSVEPGFWEDSAKVLLLLAFWVFVIFIIYKISKTDGIGKEYIRQDAYGYITNIQSKGVINKTVDLTLSTGHGGEDIKVSLVDLQQITDANIAVGRNYKVHLYYTQYFIRNPFKLNYANVAEKIEMNIE